MRAHLAPLSTRPNTTPPMTPDMVARVRPPDLRQLTTRSMLAPDWSVRGDTGSSLVDPDDSLTLGSSDTDKLIFFHPRLTHNLSSSVAQSEIFTN